MGPDVADKIPVSVLIVTRNEEKNLARCLASLERFDEILVVDSNSVDKTAEIARSFNVPVINFSWNGAYPKKRQWCLDTLPLKHDWVFFIDADEEATGALCDEIAALDFRAAGYFIKGLYVVGGEVLRYGASNNKLCLIDRRRICFPVVDDLDIPGMGEIEGHYQPVLKSGVQAKFAKLKHAVLHHALDDEERYAQRHEGYALWLKGMNEKNAFPQDPVLSRHFLKKLFYKMPAQRTIYWLYAYVFKLGFLNHTKSVDFLIRKSLYFQGTGRSIE